MSCEVVAETGMLERMADEGGLPVVEMIERTEARFHITHFGGFPFDVAVQFSDGTSDDGPWDILMSTNY